MGVDSLSEPTVTLLFLMFGQRKIDMMEDGIAFSSRTLTKMNSKLRTLLIRAMRKQRKKTGQQLGGRDEFVMIDESNFCHKRQVIPGSQTLFKYTPMS